MPFSPIDCKSSENQTCVLLAPRIPRQPLARWGPIIGAPCMWTSLFLPPVVAKLAWGWLVIQRGSGRGSGVILVLCPWEQIRVLCQGPLRITTSAQSKCLCLCYYMPTFKKLLILKNVFTGRCKEMHWETHPPPPPVFASCITIVEHQYQETDIGTIHRASSDFIVSYL